VPIDPTTGEELPYTEETSAAADAIDKAMAEGATSGSEILGVLETQGFAITGGPTGEAPMEDVEAMPEEGMGEEALEEAPPEEGPPGGPGGENALRIAAVQFGLEKDKEKKAKAQEEYA